MIYTYLGGRLGNCLFEIAAGASLAKRMGVPFITLTCRNDLPGNFKVSDLELYRKSILRKIDFLDKCPENVEYYNEPAFNYVPLPMKKDIVLSGLYQSEKYFDAELVRELFAIDPQTETYLRDKYGAILNKRPVSIHIRRGDYLTPRTEWEHLACRLKYFKKAISLFSRDTVFLVLSDDSQWCKKHFKGDNFYFTDNELPVSDLYLQSLCSHHIISNSTFSWWGAWLNPNPDKKVIYPSPWFGRPLRKKLKTYDLCPDNWIKLPLCGKYELIIYELYLWIRFKIFDKICKIKKLVFLNTSLQPSRQRHEESYIC